MSEQIAVRTVPGTKWRNPTAAPVTFTLNISGVRVMPSGRVIPRVTRDVVIMPGESLVIESEYDQAIQKVKDGVAQSGLAHMLVRMKDGEDVTIPPHPALLEIVSTPANVDPASREARVRAKRSAP